MAYHFHNLEIHVVLYGQVVRDSGVRSAEWESGHERLARVALHLNWDPLGS